MLPGRVVRAADVADLALAHERVQGLERLVERRLAVPLVDLQEVDVVGPQAPQRGLGRGDDVVAREAGVVGPLAHREAHLGGEQEAVAAAAVERLADDLLRRPVE